MYNNFQQNPYYNQMQYMSNSLKGRPVTSFDEAKVAQIDLDGSINYFPDIANNKIYTKQIKLDGTVAINMYNLTPIQEEEKKEYITREEFQKAMEELKQVKTQVSVPNPKVSF